MTIGQAGNRVSFNCDGSTKTFPVPLQAYLNTDFDVLLTSATGTESTLTLFSDYTLAAASSDVPPKWSLTTLAATAFPAGAVLQVLVDPDQVQQTQFVQGQAFPSLAVMTAFDRITQMIQRLQDQVNRTVRSPDGDVSPQMMLPAASLRAGLVPVFDDSGNIQASAILAAGTTLSRAVIAGFLYPIIQAESSVTVVDQGYPYYDVRRYGALGNGGDDTPAFTAANTVGGILVSGSLVYRLASTFTSTVPMFIDSGTSIAMDNGTLLNVNGPLTQRSAVPFTGLGSVVYNYMSMPGRVAAKLSGFASGVPFYSEAPYDAFGDSYTAGMGATSGATCYAAIIGARYNASFNNRGVSGTGVTKAIVQAFTFLPPYKCKQRSITWMAGFNDLVRQGAKATTLQKISDCTNAFLANAFLEFCVPASDSSVTLSGTWAGVTPTVLGDKSSTALNGTGEFTNTLNDTATWTFNGESVVVGFWSSDGTVHTLSPFTVSIDGNIVDTVTPEGATDGNQGGVDTYQGMTHNVRVYTSLGSGSHTIVLKNTANNSLFIDYFGTLAPPGECPSVLMAEIPFMNGAGYAIETLRSRAIDTATNLVEEAIVKQWQTWGFPVAWVPTNDYYDVTLNAYSDNIHPDQAGHVQLAQGFTSRAFPALMSALMGCTVVKTATQSCANSTTTPISWDAAANNLDGFWNSGAPTILTMPAAGTIRVSGNIGFTGNSSGVRAAVIYKNAVAWKTVGGAAATTGNATIMGFSMDIQVNAGDTIALEASQNSGGALNLTTDTQMDVAYVR